MANQDKLDERYLAMAKEWSKMSHAKRKKVGCLIVKDEQIISDGYNGTPSGFNNECEHDSYKNGLPILITKPEVLHAESNALMKLARSTNSSEGATIYCTYSPCFDCAKLIVQSGVKRFVYNETYRNTEGLDLLKKAGVEIVNYE
jgi:dCMP deaminase|tara:strand:- start:104 stop:538 length:435 start_codon:yes stop_codon:yes gene_type:complete